MNRQSQESGSGEQRGYGFVVGLVTGTFVGAGLAMWLAPRAAAELRRQMSDSAKRLGKQASEQYEQTSTRVGEAVDDLARKAQGVGEGVAEAVAHGAHEVERFARAAKSERR